MKIPILSDIHGNYWALNKVLNDIKSKEIETIINLGDSLNGPLNPKRNFQVAC
jgi:predicted phosphodiesterase